MTPAQIEDASIESRADAGLTQYTDQGIAYESGFEMGANWARLETLRSKEVQELVKLAEFYIRTYPNEASRNGFDYALAAFDSLLAERKIGEGG